MPPSRRRKPVKAKRKITPSPQSLHEAIFKDNKTAFAKFLPLEAEKFCQDGFLPLHRACRMNRYAFAKALLDFGVDPNQPDKRGVTPIYDAISGRIDSSDAQIIKMIRLLSEYGADFNVTARDHYSGKDECPLAFAERMEVENIYIETRNNKKVVQQKRKPRPQVIACVAQHVRASRAPQRQTKIAIAHRSPVPA